MQVQIDTTTRQIVGFGTFPTPPADGNLAVVEITDAQAAKLMQAGLKTLSTNGQITVTPPDPNAPDPYAPPPNPKRDAAITALKAAAGGTGATATLARAMLDLHGIS